MNQLFGGIELGGTKTICAVGDANGKLAAHETFPTTSVKETFQSIYGFFNSQPSITALGIGSFGPLNIDKHSEDYGSIYNAPKDGWTDVALLPLLSGHFNVPIEIDLDVNCAALGELYFGAAKDVASFVYITLGTGIGGSLVINKQVIHGILNLEMGHIRLPYDSADGFKGVCKFHGDCLEGVASGYAMQKHYSQRAEEIDSMEIWDQEASFIALTLNNVILTTGPEKIVLGGGLLGHEGLIEQVRSKLSATINDYLPMPNLDSYIVRSSGDKNGVLGAIKLAGPAG